MGNTNPFRPMGASANTSRHIMRLKGQNTQLTTLEHTTPNNLYYATTDGCGYVSVAGQAAFLV